MLSSLASTVLWITFDMIGQLALFLLLGTLALVKSLRQRDNPFLVNFLLTTFFATIPSSLLLFTGDIMNLSPPRWLCLTQSVLMDGIAPMFSIAFFVLAFHTWLDLRALFSGRISVTGEVPWIKWLLLLAPYVTLVMWCTASLTAAFLAPSKLEHVSINCGNNSSLGSQVRRSVGIFVFGVGLLALIPEVCICRFVYRIRSSSAGHLSSKSYNSSYQLGLRILMLCIWQLAIILLCVLSSVAGPISNGAEKKVTQLLESSNALVTFLIFGTQTDVLRAWKFWKRQETPNPEGHPPGWGNESV